MQLDLYGRCCDDVVSERLAQPIDLILNEWLNSCNAAIGEVWFIALRLGR